jgi:hypothetical protein
MNYDEFLKSKVKLAQDEGLSIEASTINLNLKPDQAACVEWLVKGVRRGLGFELNRNKFKRRSDNATRRRSRKTRRSP